MLCVVKDVVDPVTDERLAKFVVQSHHRSHPKSKQAAEAEAEAAQAAEAEGASTEPKAAPEAGSAESAAMSHDLLRKYITYAKQYCQPKLQHADADKISRVYADLRREFVTGQGVPIAVRHVESLIRMSEASARMHLREYVNDQDVNLAIQTCLESFISTQKYSVQRTLMRKFKGYLSFQKDFNALALDVLRSMVREAMHYNEMIGRVGSLAEGIPIKLKNYEEKAREYSINDLEPFFSSDLFSCNGFTLDRDQGRIVFTRPVEADGED